MKITIDIPELYLHRLRTWASVSRTLNESRALLDELAAQLEMEDVLTREDEDRVERNVSELGEIEPALNALHVSVRQAIWEKDKGGSPVLEAVPPQERPEIKVRWPGGGFIFWDWDKGTWVHVKE